MIYSALISSRSPDCNGHDLIVSHWSCIYVGIDSFYLTLTDVSYTYLYLCFQLCRRCDPCLIVMLLHSAHVAYCVVALCVIPLFYLIYSLAFLSIIDWFPQDIF